MDFCSLLEEMAGYLHCLRMQVQLKRGGRLDVTLPVAHDRGSRRLERLLPTAHEAMVAMGEEGRSWEQAVPHGLLGTA